LPIVSRDTTMIHQIALVEARSEAVAAVLSRWRQLSPELGVLVLLPEAEQGQVPDIQRVFRDQGVPLLGAIFPALLSNEGFVTQGAWLIGFDPMPPYFLLDQLNAGARTAHSRISIAIRKACALLGGEGDPTIFFIFDAMIPNIGSILNGVYRNTHKQVRYAGVNAGSETFQPIPCLFDAVSLVEKGVAGVLLMDDHVVVRHGYPVAKTLLRAISTTGNRINLINQRPALEVYQDVIYDEFGVTLTRENFYDYAVHFPFGLVMADEVVVRIPVALEDDGSMVCVGEVPPNSLLRLIKAPSLEESRCVSAITESLKSGSGVTGESLLTFYCAGRRMHLGDTAVDELIQLRQEVGVSALVGALSLGEVSTLKSLGSPVFHNAALVCL
jgi:hypothetical protein